MRGGSIGAAPRRITERERAFAVKDRSIDQLLITSNPATWYSVIASPFLPKKPVPDVSYHLMRVTAGEKPIVASADERRGISDEIATLKLRGDAHGGIGGSSGPRARCAAH